MPISTNGTVVARFAGALYNQQLSNATYNEVVTWSNTNDLNALLNAVYVRDFSSATDLSVATTIIANLGLTAVVGLDNWLSAQLTAAGSNKGAKIAEILNGFAQTPASDPIYGAAAAAWNNQVTTSQTLSQTAGNAGGSFTTLGTTPAGVTFTLTTGADIITGTAGNDTIVGSGTVESTNGTFTSTSFNTADQINGGAGTDTLSLTIDGALKANTVTAINAASISNVETLNLRNVAGTTGGTEAVSADASLIPGLTAFNSDRSTNTVTVTNLASGASAGVIGDGTVTNNTTANFGSVAGATAQTLNISGGTLGTLATTLTGTGVLATTINSTGAANVVGAITAAASSTSLAINATTALTTGAITAAGVVGTGLTISGAGAVTTNLAAVAATKLTISNSAAVSTGTLNNATVTVDASTATGAVTTTLGTSTAMVFTGGSGNDIVTAGAVLGAGAAVNGGAGTDRIVFTANGQLTAASGAKYTNFEVLQANTGVTDIDMDNIAGITSIRTSGTVTIADATATQAAAITAIASGNLNIGVKGAATVGQLDTVSITTSATNAAVAIGTLTVADVETINLTASTGTGLTSITTLAHDDWTTLNLSGSSAITVNSTATVASINTAVNGSTATGVLTLNFALSTTNGIAITGGSGNDVLTGSAQADIIVGGAGNDAIVGGAGNDTISGGDGNDTITGGDGTDTVTGGAGADTFAFAVGDNAGADGAAVADVITDFVAGTDKLQFTAFADVVSGQQAAVQAAVTALAASSTAAQIATAMAAANTTNLGVSFAVYEGNTYVYAETTGATATHVEADNVFIKLTGVTALPTFAADVVA